jgi:Fe2+ transport system protein FeoA
MMHADRNAKSVRPLDCCRRGEQVRVIEIGGGWGIRQRLNQMGIHEGGPRLIEIHGSDVALGRGIAKHILVEAAAE